MFKEISDQQELPKEIADQLAGMAFSVPASTAVYLIGFLATPLVFWLRTHDTTLTAIAAVSLFLIPLRVGLVWLWRRSTEAGTNTVRSNVYRGLLATFGCLYSLCMAALVARAFIVGELLSLGVSIIAGSGYLTGVVIRASAVPQMAIPHLLCTFIPLMAFAAAVPDKSYLVVTLLLGLWCTACIQLSWALHRRMKAQLLAEHQLSLVARQDYLTGLANRASFDARAAASLDKACANGSRVTLALLDLDGFKSVNDTHGHAAGDALLKAVSGRIVADLGNRHFVARLGGDEFAILFDPDTYPNDAIATGNRIVASLRRPFQIGDATVQVSASIGISSGRGPDDTLGCILARADKALYQAKGAGKGRVQALEGTLRFGDTQPLGDSAIVEAPGVSGLAA
jgi:diguanylate cyclase